MRTLVTLILTLLMSANTFAVTKSKKGTPPKKRVVYVEESKREPFRLGWYLAPALKFSEIEDEFETMVGIRAGLEFNRSFYIGLAGYGLPEDPYKDYYHTQYFDDDEWALGYGGLEIGVIAGRPRGGQVSLGVLIGGGSVNVDEHFFDEYYGEYDGFFVLEPQVEMMLNFSRNVRLNLGMGYRFIDDLESIRYSTGDLEGATFSLTLGFGRF